MLEYAAIVGQDWQMYKEPESMTYCEHLSRPDEGVTSSQRRYDTRLMA